MMNNEVFNFVSKQLVNDKIVCLLVVVDSSGSSPGRAGFKMAVSQDSQAGTIGGGIFEHRLTAKARKMLTQDLQEKESFCEILAHDKKEKHKSGMICSGSQSVIGYLLRPHCLEIIKKIICQLDTCKPCSLLITNRDFSLSDTGPEGASFTHTSQSNWVYTEKIASENKVIIIGGGHVALHLSRVLSMLEFHIIIYEHRKNIDTFTRNTYARKKIISAYDKLDEHIKFSGKEYLLIMTESHNLDELVLSQLINQDCHYLGMLGSQAKADEIFSRLLNRGITARQLKKVSCPMGLAINSRTAGEIAVSVAAEMIKVKNRKI
jgi:xanthine dehydrogenase accessory factor